MITLNKYRKLLGSFAEKLSDEDVTKLRKNQYTLIAIAIRVWDARNTGKKPED